MGSNTSKYKLTKKRKKSRQGKVRKRKSRSKGTTPKFEIHQK